MVALLAVGLPFGLCREEPDLSRVAAQESRLTFARDDGGSLAAVDRAQSPDVYYRVTLANAPLEAELELACDWTDPSGRVSHQNRYRTLRIDKPLWRTHCHHVLGSSAPPGFWTVRMRLEGRVLASASFEAR